VHRVRRLSIWGDERVRAEVPGERTAGTATGDSGRSRRDEATLGELEILSVGERQVSPDRGVGPLRRLRRIFVARRFLGGGAGSERPEEYRHRDHRRPKRLRHGGTPWRVEDSAGTMLTPGKHLPRH